MRMKNHYLAKEMSRQKVSRESKFNRKRSQKKCEDNRIQERRFQEKEMPTDRDVKRKRSRPKAAEKTSVSRDSDDIRKTLSGEKSGSSLGLQSCQQDGLSRFRDDKGKPDQEKVASSQKDVERQSISKDHAVNGRDSQKRGSCRLSLSLSSLLGFPPFETSVTRLARALLVIMIT